VTFARDDPTSPFSNLYSKPIAIDGVMHNSVVNVIEAARFVKAPASVLVSALKSARDAFNFARTYQNLVTPNWQQEKVAIMKRAVWEKFTQNSALRSLLLSTGKRTLVEHTANDKFWGDNGDGTGQNMLGKILMEVRQELQANNPNNMVGFSTFSLIPVQYCFTTGMPRFLNSPIFSNAR